MTPARSAFRWRLAIALAVAALIVLTSSTTGVWALPGQYPLRQTVPTRTPAKPGTTVTSRASPVGQRTRPIGTTTLTPAQRSSEGVAERQRVLFGAAALVAMGCVAYILIQRGGTTRRE
jgi:hypothetical protein